MKSILFLDIDGVLNHHDAPSINHERALLPECLRNLNMVLGITNCKVVIISNWAQQMSLQQLSQKLYDRGMMDNTIIDAIKMIPLDESGMVMGIEKDLFVADYVAKNNLENYVIVDDNFPNAAKFAGHIVAPNMNYGLTENDAISILTIFNL